MKLAKLLVAGKSIINGREEISYRANKHVYLPKFGPIQNPFQSPAGAASAEPGPEAMATPVRKVAAPRRGQNAKNTALAARPDPRHLLGEQVEPDVNLARCPGPAENAPQPVQSELSLEAVKVVHNDLSDADVEVVPMKSRPADGTGVPELPPPTRPWEFLAERMFHATRE